MASWDVPGVNVFDPSESNEIGAEYGHVHGNAQPIITLLEIYDISTL
jgi:hypothetical protein